MAATDAGRHLWERTDLKPGDVDVANLYDGFSILTLIWLEALGFCGKGESGPFVEGRAAHRAGDGVLPLNTGGGQLSAGRLHGFGLLWETCIQLWGEGGDRQVAGQPASGDCSALGAWPSGGLHAAHRVDKKDHPACGAYSGSLRTPCPSIGMCGFQTTSHGFPSGSTK